MFQALSKGARAPVARILTPRPVLVETVRGRKSRDDPKAKSKVGRIKYPPPVDPVEMVVLKQRFEEYNLIMKALRMQFKEEMLRKRYDEETGSLAEARAKQEAEEHRALMELNNQENERLRKIREVRVQKEQEEYERKQMKTALRRQRDLDELVKEKEAEILALQEEVKNFITLENLDERIEQVLDSPKNHNFAINKEGRIVKRTVLQ